MASKLNYIKPLNAIRGVAALMVVLFHCFRLHFFSHYLDLSCFSKGYFAVDMFFILSGFVLMHVYCGKFESVSPKSYYQFMVSRFARVYPVHFAMIAILFGIELLKMFVLHIPAFTEYKSPLTLLTSLLMIQAWHLHPINPWNSVSWSISAEWFCYFLAPFIISFWDRAKSLVLGLFLFFLPAFFLVQYTAFLHKEELTFEAGLLRMVIEFLMGVSVYGAYSALRHRSLPPLLVDGAAVLSLGTLLLSHFLQIPNLAIIYLCGALILLSSLSTGYFGKMLSHKVLFYLGEISYSMYLVHGVLFYNVFNQLTAKLPAQNALMSFLSLSLLLGITLISAAMTYHWIEKPAREFIRNRLTPRPITSSRKTEDVIPLVTPIHPDISTLTAS
jgi:peptidoglycan/LPS O-acetylase OafA/YrhL